MTSVREESATQRRVSILDVARKAGVSRQTVTRATNDMPGISAETKSRVLDAARELHYRPSRFGRGLVKQDTLALGLLVVDLKNAFFAEFASHMIAIAAESGWTVLVQEAARDRDRERRILASLAAQVDAIVGYLLLDDDEVEEQLGDLPVVRLSDVNRGDRRPWVCVDHAPGMSAALDHLIRGGRRNILMIDCPNGSKSSPRGRTYSEQYAARGFSPTIVEIPDGTGTSVDSVSRAFAGALAADPSIDAVIGFNDIVAIGVLQHLRSTGAAVPADFAVVGMDGLPMGEFVTPKLTTLKLDLAAVARTVFDTMVRMIADPGSVTERPAAVVSHSLTIRESSASPT